MHAQLAKLDRWTFIEEMRGERECAKWWLKPAQPKLLLQKWQDLVISLVTDSKTILLHYSICHARISLIYDLLCSPWYTID